MLEPQAVYSGTLELKLHAKVPRNSTFVWALHTSLFCLEITGLLFARFPFTMLVLQKAVRMVQELPDVMRIAYAFVVVMLCWMALWSFGVSGIVAFGIPNGGQWWLLLVSWQVFTILLYKYLVPLLFRCFFNNISCICRFFQSVYFGLELSLAIQFMSLSQGWFSSFSFMVVQLLQQCPQSLFWNLFSMLWQLHLEAFAMDHFLPLLLGLYDGRFAFLLPLFILCRLASFYSSHRFFLFYLTPYRFVEFVLKLAAMSVCYVVLIFCFILWRHLFASSTNMHMYRWVMFISSVVFKM